MTRDTASEPNEPILWIGLARAETGLKNYLDAETNFKKALDLESKAVMPAAGSHGRDRGWTR